MGVVAQEVEESTHELFNKLHERLLKETATKGDLVLRFIANDIDKLHHDYAAQTEGPLLPSAA